MNKGEGSVIAVIVVLQTKASTQCWFNVRPASVTINQPCVTISCSDAELTEHEISFDSHTPHVTNGAYNYMNTVEIILTAPDSVSSVVSISKYTPKVERGLVKA